MQRRIHTPTLVLAVVKSAAWAGLTLIDPNRLTGWRKQAYWLAMAGGTAVELATPPVDDGVDRSADLTPGIAVGAAGLTYGAQELLARGDAWSMDLLRRVGLKRPRVWAAGAVFAAMLATHLAEARLARAGEWDLAGYDDEGRPLPETLGPLPGEAREIIAALLAAVDGYGSEELRAQLDDVVCRAEMGDYTLVTDEESPATLLDSYTFPASAIFSRDGLNHVLMLDIEDGRMAYLSHLVEPYPDDDGDIDWSLPSPEEVRITVGLGDTAEAE